MLFIVDIQNNYIDANKGNMYVKHSERLLPGIIKKIEEYEEKNDEIFYTLDIYTKGESNIIEESDKEFKNKNDLKNINIRQCQATEKEKWEFSLPDILKPYLDKYEVLKKSHYALPPEALLGIQQRFNKEKKIIREIEFVGVETHICVLANAICMRSAFPEANILVNASLCMSNDMEKHKKSLDVMKSLGIEIRSGK